MTGMQAVLAIDFGSTYTKVMLFDLRREEVVSTARAPSTVETDVNEGLREALARLWATVPGGERSHSTVACSSAAGGLKVVVIGLVPALSLEAAQQAALGAGAKIVGAFGYKLTVADVQLLEQSRPDIIVLAGGTDGGDEETIEHNARMLAPSALDAPVIVAGNRAVAPACRDRLLAHGKSAILTDNLLPEVDRVNADPVHRVIRELFMSRIVHAKGIDRARKHLRGGIIPTPAAVLRAAELLAVGTAAEPGLGELIVVDVGGATTDVHSAATGAPRAGVVLKGLPEPFVKRTVEGDLGLRVNAPTLLERAGQNIVERWAVVLAGSTPDVRAYIARISTRTEYVPETKEELAMDAALGRAAVSVALERHAGRIREVYTSAGAVQVQHGKDLSGVSTVIGTGGVFAFGAYPRFVLEGSLPDPASPCSLRPWAPSFYVDSQYILYGIGLLAGIDPDRALRIAKKHLAMV